MFEKRSRNMKRQARGIKTEGDLLAKVRTENKFVVDEELPKWQEHLQ